MNEPGKLPEVGGSILKTIASRAPARERDNYLNAAWRSILSTLTSHNRDELIEGLIDEKTLPKKLDHRILNNIIDRAEDMFMDGNNPAFERRDDHWEVAHNILTTVRSVPDFPEPKQSVTQDDGTFAEEQRNELLRFCLYFDLKTYVKRWVEKSDDPIPLNFYRMAVYGHEDKCGTETLPYLIEQRASEASSIVYVMSSILRRMGEYELGEEVSSEQVEPIVEALFEEGLDPNTSTDEDRPALSILMEISGDKNDQLLTMVAERMVEQSISDETARAVHEVAAGEHVEPGPAGALIEKALLQNKQLPSTKQLRTMLDQESSPEFRQVLNEQTTKRQRDYARIDS